MGGRLPPVGGEGFGIVFLLPPFHTKKQRGNMQIPTRFTLLGHTVNVIQQSGSYYRRNEYGAAGFEAKEIILAPKEPGHPIPQSSVEHTFLHELIHMCLYHTEQAALNENEHFVDLLSGLLHQAFTTMEFD